jgi:aryl-alcohol dehydrogenase-like predicted oxidoreductase
MTDAAEGTRLSFRTQVDGPRFWHDHGFRVAAMVERISLDSDVPMARAAIAWPLKRKFVASVIIGARTLQQLEENMVPGDWDLPDDVWKALEEQTRPEEEYHTWFNKRNYERFFDAAEFHDELKELP